MVEAIQSRRKVQWWYSTPKKEEPKKLLIKVGDIWVTPASEVPELDEGKAQAYAYRNLDW